MHHDLTYRLQNYLQLRQALGFPTSVDGRLLEDFIRFMQQHKAGGAATAQLAVDWVFSTTNGLSASAQAGRLSRVRGFLSYLRAFTPETEVPPFGLLARVSRPHPYLFSGEQISSLLKAARSLKPADSLRPHTYFTLIGLLASCGLRGGEAIRLNREDVQLDLHPPRLHIQKTKFRKSRLVPLHPSTTEALRAYSQECQRRGYHRPGDAFFISDKGTRLNYQTAARTVVALARQLGMRGPMGQRGPSLHALRHAFAIERLRSWYQEGINTQRRLNHLAVYMGHIRMEYTYWYLTATPELLSAAATRFESYCGKGGGR